MRKTLNFTFYNNLKKRFSVLPKVVKMELSMRTPYKTFFADFNGFSRIYVNTLKGQLAISNRTFPAIYLLPAGEIKVMGVTKGKGNFTSSTTGEFIHSGGHAMVHE